MIALMDVKSIAAIDGRIRQLEKELSALYQQRVGLLEVEISHSRDRIESFAGAVIVGATEPEVPTRRAPTPTRSKPKRAAAKRARKQASAPVRGTIASLPAATEPAKVEEAAVEPSTPAPGTKKQAAKLAKKRKRTPTVEVEKRILDVLKAEGLFGASQIELSKKTGLGYQTVVKKLKELPEVEKKGSGKAARFYLKA